MATGSPSRAKRAVDVASNTNTSNVDTEHREPRGACDLLRAIVRRVLEEQRIVQAETRHQYQRDQVK